MLALPLVLASCIKDEPLGTECDILSAWVEGETYVPIFYHSTQMRKDDIASNEHEIVFTVRSLPPTDEWTRFEMFFEGGEADPAVLSELGYNLTVVFSSSKDGAAFEGAIGSTLYVDEVEVQFENEDE